MWWARRLARSQIAALTRGSVALTLACANREGRCDVTEIDPRSVLDALGFPQHEGLAPMSGGWANAMWRFQTLDGISHVLRVYPHPEWAPAARREVAALEAAQAGGIPVPVVEASGTWHDLAAMVISWCEGVPLLTALQRKPWTIWRLGRVCGQLQARIHAVAPPARLLREGSRWRAELRVNANDADSRSDPDASGTAFIHGDYHPVNILTDGNAITGVVDWTSAGAADPRLDLAWTTALLSAGPIPPHPLRPLFSALRRLALAAWLRGYGAEAGPVGEMAPFLAFAGMMFFADVQAAVREGRGWATAADLDRIRRWTERWRARAGLTGVPAARGTA